MRKTFEINHPKIKPARMYESIKHEIKKYLKRERKKSLPEEAGFWDFDCRFGQTEASAGAIKVTEFNEKIDEAEQAGWMTFYVEILAKPGKRKSPVDKT